MPYFSDPKKEFLSSAKEAVEVLEDLIVEADVYATYLRLKEAIEAIETIDADKGINDE